MHDPMVKYQRKIIKPSRKKCINLKMRKKKKTHNRTCEMQGHKGKRTLKIQGHSKG